MSGYVRIHRSLIGHPAFRNDAEAMAFAWMVAKAAWKPAKTRYKGHDISLQRGQLTVSIRDFAEAMDRPKGWVERLFVRLREHGMIEQKNGTEVGTRVGTHGGTGHGTPANVITICNYTSFQASANDDETLEETVCGTAAGQRRDTEQIREEVKNISSEDKSSSPRAKFPPPPNVSSEQWQAFRQQRKKALNSRSYRLICNKLIELAEAGYPPGDMIDLAIERGWETAFKPRNQFNDRQQRNGNDSLRGNRPDPALDLYRAAVAEEQRQNGPPHRGAGAALPAIGSG